MRERVGAWSAWIIRVEGNANSHRDLYKRTQELPPLLLSTSHTQSQRITHTLNNHNQLLQLLLESSVIVSSVAETPPPHPSPPLFVIFLACSLEVPTPSLDYLWLWALSPPQGSRPNGLACGAVPVPTTIRLGLHVPRLSHALNACCWLAGERLSMHRWCCASLGLGMPPRHSGMTSLVEGRANGDKGWLDEKDKLAPSTCQDRGKGSRLDIQRRVCVAVSAFVCVIHPYGPRKVPAYPLANDFATTTQRARPPP